MTLFAHAAPAEWPQAAVQFGYILPGPDRLSRVQRGSIHQLALPQAAWQIGY